MPVISKSQRYAPRALIEILFLETVAAVNADGLPEPTSAELTASTRLTREVFEISGFTTKTNYAQTSDAGTFFIGKIPTSAEADDASISFNASKTGDDARALFEQNQDGYIVIAPAWEEGALAEVYPVSVGSVSLPRDLDAPQLVVVSFATPSEPNQKFVIPTGVTLPSYGA